MSMKLNQLSNKLQQQKLLNKIFVLLFFFRFYFSFLSSELLNLNSEEEIVIVDSIEGIIRDDKMEDLRRLLMEKCNEINPIIKSFND